MKNDLLINIVFILIVISMIGLIGSMLAADMGWISTDTGATIAAVSILLMVLSMMPVAFPDSGNRKSK